MILVARDALIMGAAVSSWRLTGKLEFPPSKLGKLHTAVVFTVMSVVIAQMAGWLKLGDLLPALFIAPVVTAVLSGVHYLWIYTRARRRHLLRRIQCSTASM